MGAEIPSPQTASDQEGGTTSVTWVGEGGEVGSIAREFEFTGCCQTDLSKMYPASSGRVESSRAPPEHLLKEGTVSK